MDDGRSSSIESFHSMISPQIGHHCIKYRRMQSRVDGEGRDVGYAFLKLKHSQRNRRQTNTIMYLTLDKYIIIEYLIDNNVTHTPQQLLPIEENGDGEAV